MKNILTALILITGFVSFTQEIQWGDLEKAKGRLRSILPVSGGDFYTTMYPRGAMLGSIRLSKYSNFSFLTQEKIASVVDGRLADIEGVTSFNSKVVAFLSDKRDGQNKLFMQQYDEVCMPEGDPVLLTEYTMPKGWRKSGYFNILQSQNQKFVCIEYSLPATNLDGERFGYKILDENLRTVSEGEYESPYDPQQSDISNRYISNTGDYFIAVKVYNLNSRGRVKDYSSLEKVALMHVTSEGTEEMNLELGDRHISELTFSSDNNRLLTCTGLYNEAGYGVKGIVYFQLDFKKKQILNEGYTAFDQDFITSDWSDYQKKKADKRAAKGKGEPVLYDYEFRENVTLPDGSLVGVIEQYYVRMVTTTSTSTTGTTYRTNYHYYYNDLVTYKVSPGGEFIWVKKIPKRQASVNDFGYLSSIAQYTTDDKVVLLFNDNLRNYDEEGNFIQPERGELVEAASFRKKTNCVAKVEVDLESGEVSRTPFFKRSEQAAVAVPKLFNTDYNNRELLMVLIMGKKQKFGLLKF